MQARWAGIQDGRDDPPDYAGLHPHYVTVVVIRASCLLLMILSEIKSIALARELKRQSIHADLLNVRFRSELPFRGHRK